MFGWLRCLGDSLVAAGEPGPRRPIAPGPVRRGSGVPGPVGGRDPAADLDRWDFRIQGQVEQGARWSWPEFQALPREDVTVDIHCVTSWSKFDTRWAGVSVDTLLEQVQPTAAYVTAFSDGGYTTNLPLADLTGGKAWVVDRYDGAPLQPHTADRPGCWCPTSTSGSPRSGYAG